MKRKRVKVFFGLMFILAATNTFQWSFFCSACLASQQGDLPEVEVVDFVDVERFMGLWYEIASIPSQFQSSCTGGTTAEYTLLEDGSVSNAGRPRDFLDVTATLIGPDLETTELALPQVGAGRYEAGVELSQPGTYLVRLGVGQDGDALGQQTLGLVVPYSPEYVASGTDRALLGGLARLTRELEIARKLVEEL